MNNKNTGEFISACRKGLGLTQIQLAEKLNVTNKAVSKWENGKSAPDISTLLPLAEALNVSVVEILNGERMEPEEVQEKSNATIVETMRISKQKLFVGIISAVIVVMLLISLYPLYHYFTTVSVENDDGIQRLANQYMLRGFGEKTDMELIEYERKGNYLVALLKNDSRIAVVVFDEDEVFKGRYAPSSGSSSVQFGDVRLHCFGENGMTLNIFYGAEISSDFSQYKFEYRDVEYICPIENNTVFDVFIDINRGFTNAHSIELIK